MSQLSETLKELRREKELTQKELAFLLEVKQSTIADWESGRYTPALNKLITIADKLDIPYDVVILPLIGDIKQKTA